MMFVIPSIQYCIHSPAEVSAMHSFFDAEAAGHAAVAFDLKHFGKKYTDQNLGF